MHERVEKLNETISRSRGWRLRRELSGVARGYRVFLGNDRELRQFLDAHAQPDAALALWDDSNREGFERFLDEVDRLLHNYLASAASLRDHTRRLWQKYPPADAALAQEYERRAAAAFASPFPAVAFWRKRRQSRP